MLSLIIRIIIVVVSVMVFAMILSVLQLRISTKEHFQAIKMQWPFLMQVVAVHAQ